MKGNKVPRESRDEATSFWTYALANPVEAYHSDMQARRAAGFQED